MKYVGIFALLAMVAAVTLADFADTKGIMRSKMDIVKGAVAIDANFEMVKAQSDTNATTTTTGYTPDFAGQVLVGGAGAGTNGVWIAKGITTNDWVQVAP